MLSSTYQRVGTLAGLLLFFGSWLTGFYNNWVWAALTLGVVGVALWFALDDQSEQETSTRVIRGLVTGLICGVVARGLGLLTMVWAFDSWTSSTSSSYSVISDYLRVMLNGNFWLSLAGIALAALAGAFIAYALPYFVTEKETE